MFSGHPTFRYECTQQELPGIRIVNGCPGSAPDDIPVFLLVSQKEQLQTWACRSIFALYNAISHALEPFLRKNEGAKLHPSSTFVCSPLFRLIQIYSCLFGKNGFGGPTWRHRQHFSYIYSWSIFSAEWPVFAQFSIPLRTTLLLMLWRKVICG